MICESAGIDETHRTHRTHRAHRTRRAHRAHRTHRWRCLKNTGRLLASRMNELASDARNLQLK